MSFSDQRGVEHRTLIHAQTVLEAAALGLRAFREQGILDDDGVFDLRVEVTTRTTHIVPFTRLRAWLESNEPDPKRQSTKARLRG